MRLCMIPLYPLCLFPNVITKFEWMINEVEGQEVALSSLAHLTVDPRVLASPHQSINSTWGSSPPPVRAKSRLKAADLGSPYPLTLSSPFAAWLCSQR